MTDRLASTDSALDDLRNAVQRLEARVARLEALAPAVQEAAAGAADSGDGQEPSALAMAPRGWRDPIALLPLLGRLFIVLGGAYLLRAMTEAGTLPPPAGVGLGLAYGLAWLVLADRAGARQQVPSAVFHAIGAAMVAFPVVLEATTRFNVLPGPAAAVALGALTAGILAVAWRRRIQALAWIAVAAAVPVSIVMLARTGIVVPHALFLILFGVATLWMGYSLDWLFVRWPVAAAANAVAVGVTLRALAPHPQETPGAALIVQATLLGAYLVSIAIRTLVRGRNVVPFEVVQTVAALAVGLGGALSVTRATGSGAPALGVASALFGAACYGVAFAFIERTQGRARNVYFYTSLAVVLVLVGVTTLLQGAAVTGVLAALAVIFSVAWSRIGRLFLLLHAAVYLLAAAFACGAVAYDLREVIAGAGPPWPQPTPAMIVVLIASALSAWFASREPEGDGSSYASLPRFVIVLMLVLSAGGTLIGAVAPVVGRQADGSMDAGIMATLRTSVLAIAALVVAWIGRHARFREWGWLVYPLLVGIGLKMAAQDFMHSRPATLFVALALYGVALIMAPRMRRRQA